MADLKQLLRGVAAAAVDAVRATVVDYDAASRELWISERALNGALRRRNPPPGLLSAGLELQAAIVEPSQLRLDVQPRPLGPAGTVVMDGARLTLTPSHYAVAFRIKQSTASMEVMLLVLPVLLDVLLGLGAKVPALSSEDGLVSYRATMPSDSWFVSMLRSLGALSGDAEIPIRFGRGGVLIDLSGVVPVGTRLDAGALATRFLFDQPEP